MKNFRLFVLVAAVLSVAGDATTEELKPTEGIDDQWEKAIVTIEEVVKGKLIVHGTAFIVEHAKNEQILVTAKHVVMEARNEAELKFTAIEARRAGRLEVQESVFRAEGWGRWYFHPTAECCV
jgi:hypothetical protein